ncbi:four helix bundle protein [Candidatus Roizmanbacteria bacterium]|nr:four helix bundle protein [Candidatus Roizmanbacteria bacterium]
MIKSFRDLQVYQEAYKLMIIVHNEVKKFPIYERTDLSSQMRRASKSIPANIAEGWAKRSHEKEFKLHLDRALGSANEMEVHAETSRDLGYLKIETSNNLLKIYQQLCGKIANLKKNWKTF